MKKTSVIIRWKEGLHLRPAGALVRLAQRFHSKLTLRLGTAVADATSVLSLVILGATLGTVLEVEASGTDEMEAIAAIEEYFVESAEEEDGEGSEEETTSKERSG